MTPQKPEPLRLNNLPKKMEGIPEFFDKPSHFAQGWNACHDEFMKVINALPSKGKPSPHELYDMTKGDMAKYKELCLLHGHLIETKGMDSKEHQSCMHGRAYKKNCEICSKGMSPTEWFTTPNPLLGNVRPIDMIKNGRGEKMCKFIENCIDGNAPESKGMDEAKGIIYCQPGKAVYGSPPQNRCKNCLKFWYCHHDIPVCKGMVEKATPEPGETPNDIAWQQGFKAGVDSVRPKQGSSAGEDLFREFGGQMKSYIGMEVCRGLGRTDNKRFGKIIDEAYDYAMNNIKAKLSPALEPLDRSELMDFMVRWDKKEYPEDYEKDPTGEEERMRIANTEIIDAVCSRFGTSQTPSVRDLTEIIQEGCGHTPEKAPCGGCQYIARAIHQLLKGKI